MKKKIEIVPAIVFTLFAFATAAVLLNYVFDRPLYRSSQDREPGLPHSLQAFEKEINAFEIETRKAMALTAPSIGTNGFDPESLSSVDAVSNRLYASKQITEAENKLRKALGEDAYASFLDWRKDQRDRQLRSMGLDENRIMGGPSPQ